MTTQSNVKTIWSFADLKAAGVQTIEVKKTELDYSKNNPIIDNLMKLKPVYESDFCIDDNLNRIAHIIDIIFTNNGIPNILAFADHIIQCLMNEAERKENNLPDEKAPLRALEYVVNNCSIGFEGKFFATRNRRLLSILSEIPAVSNNQLVKLDLTNKNEPNLIPVDKIRDASNAFDVYSAYSHINEDFFNRLETSKITKIDSLRTPTMIHLRKTVPDFGCALIIAALLNKGFDDVHFPIANLARTNFPTLGWIENIFKDLRVIISEQDETLRGEILYAFVSNENSISLEEYNKLSQNITFIQFDKDDPNYLQEKAEAIYNSDKELYDAMKVQWEILQGEFNIIQKNFLKSIDAMISYVQYKRNEKDWLRNFETAKKGLVIKKKTNLKPKILKPYQKSNIESVELVDSDTQTISQLLEISKSDFENILKTFKETYKSLTDLGLNERRVFNGIQWSVIGKFDLIPSSNELYLVIPRFDDNTEISANDLKLIAVSDYERYFLPIPA
jgi:hypothetical protein